MTAAIVAAVWWLAIGSVVAQVPEAIDEESGGPVDHAGDDAPQVETETDDVDDDRLEGRRIVEYEFRCDLQLCQQPGAVERFQQISGIAVGQRYRPELIERAQRRLVQTGFFQQLTIERGVYDDGIHIDIEATGAVLIRRVEFEGLSPPPFESELRNLLMYRPGQVYIEDAEQLAAQRSSLASMFEQEGYFGTEISITSRTVDDEPHLIDLVIDVEPGQERRICAMGFRGLRAMTSAEARELMLSGVSVLGRRVPLFVPRFTTEQFREGREALIDEYRRRGYFRARIVDQAVQIDEATNCTQLVVDVSEGPFWDIEFEGNSAIDADALRVEMPFADSGYVDDNEIGVAENTIRQLYEAQGYPFAQVDGREERGDRFDRRLIFSIDEGPRVQIDEIRFRGLEAFEPAQVLDEFGTRPFGVFDTGGFLQTEQLLSDFRQLERRYREAGYLQATVERFVVELSDAGDAITIWIYVDEGRQTGVDEVRIEGHDEIALSALESMLEVRSGSVFVPLEVQADQSRLSQHYGSMGRPEATVETTCRDAQGAPVRCRAPELEDRCIRSNFEELVEQGCSWREGATPTWVCDRRVQDETCQFDGGVVDESVSIDHRIEEGPLARVGEILLKGNFRTRSSVIFRELPLETGDVLNVNKLLEGQGNMRSLGLFDSVSIETIGLDEPSGIDGDEEGAERSIPLIISVEESRSRFVDLRFGVEGRELLEDSRRLLATGELQYIDDNLVGTGQRFRPRIIGATDTFDLYRLGADTGRGVGVAGDAGGLDYLFGAELIYTHPRFLRGQTGIDELFLTVTPFYLIDLLGVSTEQVLREEWGLRLELRKELHELMDRFFVTLGTEAKQASTWVAGDLRVDGERVFSPRRATAKLMPELTLDRRDSPLNPGDGFQLQFQPELVSGDALSEGGEDLIGDSYWRLSFAASHYFRPVDGLTVGQGVEFGQIIPLFDRQGLVPVEERYTLGGVGSIRGFPNNSLGPIGAQQQRQGGELLLNYSAELRYPLMERWGLYGATFFDAGLLVNCFEEQQSGQPRSSRQCYRNAFPQDAPLGEIRTSAGIGLRYLLVDQIPLLLDYGKVLNRRPGEGFGSLHFNLGYTF